MGKGISPLIAAVLLVAFTMSASALFAQWAPSLMQSAQQGVDERQSDVVDASSASMKIQKADFNSSSGNYTITVQNTGSTNISDYTFTIYSETNPTQKNADITIEPGGIHTVTISTSDTEKSDIGVESRNLPVRTRVSSGQVEDATGSSGSNNGGGSSTITVSGEVFYDGSGWEDVKVEIVDAGNVVASTLTDSTGSYSIDVSSGDYTVRATGASVSSTSLSDGTTIDFNVSGEVVKDGSVVDTFSSVSVSGCEVNGSTVETSYPKISGERRISTLEQLQCVNQSLSSDYGLAQDVDASETDSWNSGKGFNPIGLAWTADYQGVFDGRNYSVEDLYINRSSNYVGMFGNVNNTTVKNIGFENAEIYGKDETGVLAGSVSYKNASVVNASSTGLVNGTGWGIGGLVGATYYNADIEDSYSKANVKTGDGGAGGLAGYTGGRVESSYATGKVEGVGQWRYDLGGLVGETAGIVSNSYATGNVSGGAKGSCCMGGLVGAPGGSVKSSYATGSVKGHYEIGGLIGSLWEGGAKIKESYSTGTVTSLSTQDNHQGYGGLVGVVFRGSIESSYSTSDVHAPNNDYVGGLVGEFQGRGGEDIVDSYARGDVSGNDSVGGLIGYYKSGSSDNYFNRTYAAMDLNGNYSVGGLIGNDDNSISGDRFFDSYWDVDATGESDAKSSDASIGINSSSKGLTTSEMQGSSASSNMDGLDFQNTWNTVENPDDYPELDVDWGNSAPVPSFTYSPSTPHVGDTIEFDASGSSDPDGSISSYEWDWTNDGTYDDTGQTATRSYDTDKDYTVKLKVTDNGGKTAITTETITISLDPDNDAPTAAFTKNVTEPQAGDTVKVDASGSSDSDGSIESYEWDWTNDKTYEETGQTATFDYNAAGLYTLKLRVTDNGSKSSTVTKTVNVTNATGGTSPDGKMFVAGSNSGSIHEFHLSENFNVSTALYETSTGVSGYPSGVTFNDDGTSMYSSKQHYVNQYSLSSPYDINTSSSNGNFYANTYETIPDVAFNNDGSKMFVLESYSGDRLWGHDLSTSFDVSTASDTYDYYKGMGLAPNDVTFNDDGTKMFVPSSADDGKIREYHLSSFSIGTASQDSTFSTTSDDTEPHSVAFNSDGTEMFVTGDENDKVYEYHLSTGYDVSTASFHTSYKLGGRISEPTGIAWQR